MHKKILVIVVTTLCMLSDSFAITPPQSTVVLQRAMTLLEHRRWADARHEFLRLREEFKSDAVVADEINYGLTVCAVHLGDNNAEKRMLNYFVANPESVHTNDVHFLLGVYYSEREEWKKAKTEFEKVSYKALTRKNREHYDMRMGYAEFIGGDFDKAYEYFSKLTSSTTYADHATYYKAYIDYRRGEYDKAYDGFYALRKSNAYSPVVPYYILQLEYARGNYDYVVKNGDNLLSKTAPTYRLELLRIIAESWYRQEGYKKALLYITMYAKEGGEMGREENYLLGYSAYRTTDYNAAIEALKKASAGDDELAQNASYHLADCYIKTGNKRLAVYSFAKAADSQFNSEIAEDALFNYGKLLFDIGGGTFNESINILTRYVTTYPSSPRVGEARELLIAAYYNSHDYDAAYEAIKSFENPDGSMLTALQKISYFRGVEAFLQGDYDKAVAALVEAMTVGVSPKYNALCAFWLGEIEYRKGNYSKALEEYNFYLKRAPRSADEYKMALYNSGYANAALGNMAAASKSMEGFLWLYKTPDSYRADGYNRLGDAQYTLRDFPAALRSYEGAVALGTPEQYYAQYQRAITLGLLNQTTSKIGVLRQIVETAEGDYVDDASYELGRTYVSLEQYSNGASTLETFIATYPTSPYYIPALLDLGLIYFNLGDTSRSLSYYDKVISNNPQSSEAKDAMQSVREIYVGRGDVDTYFSYAERTGVECDLSLMTRDSLSFRAAQKIYLAGNVEQAIPQMEHYLNSYPKGYYTNDALFCLSDSYLRCDSLDRAVASLKLLADKPTNQYTVTVLEKLSQVAFDNMLYDDAADAYRRLYDYASDANGRSDAATGYVKASLKRHNDDAVMEMADNVEIMSDVPADALRAARFAKAKILDSRGRKDEAIDIFGLLGKNPTTREGAESAYIVIRSLYDAGQTDECEKAIYALADSHTTHTYWLGRAFILLGDIYFDKGDTYQAGATYRSIIDGYSPIDDGIVDEAKDKIKKIN